jgi:hypothetical protein
MLLCYITYLVHCIVCNDQVLTCRSGSALMLSLIYSEILNTVRIYGLLDFDPEIFYPHDLNSLPRGYDKHKSKMGDEAHIMTSKLLLVEVSPWPSISVLHFWSPSFLYQLNIFVVVVAYDSFTDMNCRPFSYTREFFILLLYSEENFSPLSAWSP